MNPCKNGHQPSRQQLNDWDDVTVCRRCNTWIQVHPDVRRKNPNFELKRR